jgi:hypothetical protein
MSTAININNNNVNSTYMRTHAVSSSATTEQLITDRVAQLNLLPAEQSIVINSTVPITKIPGFDLDKMSIDSLISAVMLDRYDTIKQMTEEQALKVKGMNDQLRGLGKLKAALAAYNADPSKPTDKINLDIPGATLADLKNIIKEYGLDINLDKLVDGTTITSGNLASLNTTVDNETGNTTTLQTTEYNKLQEYAQKMTQALDLASNISKKFFDTNSGIVANMR